ncbi:MAG: inositol monophosphatase [Gemmatimonadetes bacterium]|nr:inositol monophosphatase [Gemmatimonadota bacterium]
MSDDALRLLSAIRALHDRIRDSVVAACEAQHHDAMSGVAHDDVGDTIYSVDRVSEQTLVEGLSELANREPLVLIAEGLPPEGMVLPAGARESECKWRFLVDPIDGTRGLMYQKRPAWILTGVAPNKGTETRLSDIVLAVQTEIPLVKQHLCDQLWAARGHGVHARRVDRVRMTESPLTLGPSTAHTIAHGFASVSRFFPGARDVLALVDDEIALDVVGAPAPGKAMFFEDQYISTGGQLYELMAGHDRFIADIRPLLRNVLAGRGFHQPLCCHPYDLCTVLIARELGVVITGASGAPLDAPLDIEADVAWVGYANEDLRMKVEPALQRALGKYGLS